MNTQLIHKLFDVATFDESRVRSYANEDGSQTEIYQPYIPLTWCGEPTRFSITSEQINKFVELIVRDCAKIADDNYSLGIPTGQIIKQYFGVDNE